MNLDLMTLAASADPSAGVASALPASPGVSSGASTGGSGQAFAEMAAAMLAASVPAAVPEGASDPASVPLPAAEESVPTMPSVVVVTASAGAAGGSVFAGPRVGAPVGQVDASAPEDPTPDAAAPVAVPDSVQGADKRINLSDPMAVLAAAMGATSTAPGLLAVPSSSSVPQAQNVGPPSGDSAVVVTVPTSTTALTPEMSAGSLPALTPATTTPAADVPAADVPAAAPVSEAPVSEVPVSETPGSKASAAPTPTTAKEPAGVVPTAGDAQVVSGIQQIQHSVDPTQHAAFQPVAAGVDVTAGVGASPVVSPVASPVASTPRTEIPFVDPNVARVGGAVRTLHHEGGRSVSIDLTPVELGRVHVELVSRNGRVEVHLQADRSAAADVLRSATTHLRHSLEAEGLTLDHVGVGVAGDGGRSGTPGHTPDDPTTGLSWYRGASPTTTSDPHGVVSPLRPQRQHQLRSPLGGLDVDL